MLAVEFEINFCRLY